MSDFSSASSDDPRACRVDGCRRKHVFAMIGPQKVYSLYCIRHTCDKTLPDNEGYHCPCPRLADQRYCADHIRCGAPRCREKGQNDDGTWPWFCQTHRCTNTPGCRRPRKESKRFCSAHACVIPNCADDRDPSGGSLCSMHRCTLNDCSRPIADLDRADSLFCTVHGCKVRGCLRRCNYPSDFCEDHRCRKAPCARRGADGNNSLCINHRCRSADCGNEASFENGFCSAKHACVVPLCPKVRMSAGPTSPATSASGELPERCYDHQIVWVQTTVRRAVSEELQADFEQERAKWERDKKRLSDDLSEMKRREKEWQEYLRGERDMRKRRASNEAHPEPDRLHPEYRGSRNYHGGSE
ncbi:hypothetical protein B0T24DRAFT_533122 [Lasiosphaeria ovina]|uniref:Uncharacterized protein n=1 Tax=Lasiosphaeria ovina TaxID=92902 RepID=A0AAE0N480_9PEZI|nr:hypothetical protein B0T24DRAFT_533122 [Lasiosphaeria ovina]